MNVTTHELKVVAGADFFKSPCPETEIEIYQAGRTAKRAKTPRALHNYAIAHGFVFRPDARMLFRGYYRDPVTDRYAAIL